jgi:hypothetical protein
MTSPGTGRRSPAPHSPPAPKRGYARGEPGLDQVARVMNAINLPDESARAAALAELSRQRRELAETFVAESLRRARERRHTPVRGVKAA